MKKTLVILLSLALLVFPVNAYATNNQETSETNINTSKIVTENEYISNYAKNHNISFNEALEINSAENQKIIREYKSKLVSPFAIDYEDSYQEDIGGEVVTIYYIQVYDYFDDGFASIDYGAYGKVLEDSHSSTFIENAWEGFAYPGSGLYELTNERVSVSQENYTTVRVSLSGTIQMTFNNAISIGGSIQNLIDVGYTVSTNNYVRRTVRDSFRENT